MKTGPDTKPTWRQTISLWELARTPVRWLFKATQFLPLIVSYWKGFSAHSFLVLFKSTFAVSFVLHSTPRDEEISADPALLMWQRRMRLPALVHRICDGGLIWIEIYTTNMVQPLKFVIISLPLSLFNCVLFLPQGGLVGLEGHQQQHHLLHYRDPCPHAHLFFFLPLSLPPLSPLFFVFFSPPLLSLLILSIIYPPSLQERPG